jgi:hypothetical protein
MEEKPKVVVTRTRRPEPGAKEFTFTRQDVRAGGVMDTYRTHAWEAYQRLTVPDPSQEPWRRTDLRHFPADAFILPPEGAYEDLPPVREDLLKPLVGDQHGGQIVCGPAVQASIWTER